MKRCSKCILRAITEATEPEMMSYRDVCVSSLCEDLRHISSEFAPREAGPTNEYLESWKNVNQDEWMRKARKESRRPTA